MDLPEWLNSRYIEESLRKYFQDEKLKLINTEISAALGKGENYGGILTRIKTQYELGGKEFKKCLLVKSSYESNEFAKEKMEPYDIFNREMSIYEDVLPNLNALLKSIHDDDQLFATIIRVDYKHQALVFEDLSERGFKMANRVECLDAQHAELIVRKIAKMHATSAVFNELHEKCLEKYDRGFFNQYTDNYSTFFVGTLHACALHLSQISDYKHYADKLFALEPKYMDLGRGYFKPLPGQVNVLNHGDLWTNNFMFKYNSKNEPIDAILIDFQYTFWSSPGVDLHYFFNTSLKDELRLSHQDKFLQYYHGIFTDMLRKLNYRSHPIPSLRGFRLQTEKTRFYAFHSSCVIQPLMINTNCDDADFNTLMSTDEKAIKFKNELYRNPRVQKNLKILIPFFDRKGLLDYDQSE